MYEWDVFISYRRLQVEDTWLTQHFVPTFGYFLSNAFSGPKEPKYFFDQKDTDLNIRQGELVNGSGIEPGRPWRVELERAIRTSRCMVGLWSPPYFRSRWCQIEWRSFANRSGNPLVAASLHNRAKLPAEARDFQIIDVSDFTLLGNLLVEGRLEEKFRDAMRKLADLVVARIETIVDFKDWPIAPYEAEPEPLKVALPTFADAGR